MKRLVFACLLAAAAVPALADEIEIVNPDQSAFRAVSKDVVSAFNYKALYPAEATGLTGFGLGGFGSYLGDTDNQAWQTLTGEDVSALGMAGISAHKGLPLGFDVGAFYAWVPEVDAGIFGAEVRYAILPGGIAEPAIAIRGGYTRSTGIDDFDVSTYSVDASISKGFAFLTPYAGAGYVWGRVDPGSDIALSQEDPSVGRVFVGLRFSLVLFEITPEYEHVGDNDVFNLRLGFSI